MNENLLSYIWQFQYFSSTSLHTSEGHPLAVWRTGFRNRHAGPDFCEARIVIDTVQWIGSIEIHVRSSDWYQHGHAQDGAYEGVILHVVWEDDMPVRRRDGTLLPCLILRDIVQEGVLERYAQLQEQHDAIPCRGLFEKVENIQKLAMLDRVLLERLDRKASEILQMYQQERQDWDTVAYQWIGRHYGFKLNDPVFLRLTQALPFRIIRRHQSSLMQLEALLFGSAGMLSEHMEDEYGAELYREFCYLKNKYQLENTIHLHEWKFAKLRPAGFPTVRMAQFARLLSCEANLFSMVINAPTAGVLKQRLSEKQSDYWTQHYVFGKPAAGRVPAMGKGATEMLIINAMVPLLVAFSKQKQQSEPLERAVQWLSMMEAEDNYLIRQWAELGMEVKTASDSQALIEWHQQYCVPKLCLECTVGAALVRNG